MAATKPRNLRTGRPVWTAYRAPAVPALELWQNIKADVAVIGAGISGAMIAQELVSAGMDVVILDRRGALKGSTAATTALLQYELDMPVSKLQEKIGRDSAARAWQRSRLGLESLVDKIRSLDIACDFACHPSIYLSGDVLDAKGLMHEMSCRRSTGLPCDYLDRAMLENMFGIEHEAALVTPGGITVNPMKMAAGFLKDALENGARLFAPVMVENAVYEDGHVRIVTDAGVSVTAGHAIFATGYEMPERVVARRHKLLSTYAIATRPQPENLWPEQALVWEAADPYLYIRTTGDGRVICGGGDEDFVDDAMRDALLPAKTTMLEAKLKKIFPQLDVAAEYAWCGTFGGSTTGLPSIGSVPGWGRVMAVMAYGGNGIVFSRIAAEIIRAQLTGSHDTAADLFRF